MPSLLNMPGVIMNLILEKLDFRSIECLRKSRRDLRKFIDDVKPESKLSTFEVTDESDETKQIVIKLYLDKQHSKIAYHKNENGCLVMFNEKEKLLENSDFLDVAFRDIQFLLCSKNALNYLNITASSLLERIQNILRSRSPKINVQLLTMDFQILNQVIEFLPLLGTVEGMNLVAPWPMRSTILDVSELLKTEHWKKLKEFRTHYFLLDVPIDELVHLKEAYISIKDITMDMVLRLKKEFLRSPHMSHFVFYYEQFDSDHEQLVEKFGQVHDQYDGDSSWLLKIPTEPGNYLQIANRVSQEAKNFFSFARVDSKLDPID